MKTCPAVVLIMLSILLISCDQKKKENVFSIGKADSLHSEVMKESRKFFVYLPPSYDGSDTSKHYPVMYLLDGGSHFHSVTGLLDQLTSNGFCPEMIVIAIVNTDRSRDLTPSHSMKLPNGEVRQFLETSGGAENFTRFIEKELFPYVEKNYPTAPYRMLVGHSFGGLFAINTMMHHTGLFNSYVAIDPSLWWDNRKLLLETDTLLKEKDFKNKTLFVSVANTMPSGMDTLQVSTDTTGNTSHIRSILRFSKNASVRKNVNGMNFSWKYYSDEHHGSVPLISEFDALRWIFGFYRMNYDPAQTAQDFTDHYRNVSEKLRYTMLPPQDAIDERGHMLKDEKKFDQAYAYFELNLKNFPGSQRAHSSMGDYYQAIHDNEKAKEWFSKALEIKEDKSIRRKIEGLDK